MSNVFSIAWRIPCSLGLRASSTPPFSTAPAHLTLRLFPRSLQESFSQQRPYSFSCGRPLCPIRRWILPIPRRSQQSNGFIGNVFSRFAHDQKGSSPRSGSDTQPKQPPVEHGVPVSSKPLSPAEIKSIFNAAKVSPVMGNRIISVLQGRRLQGTLDLSLPEDIKRAVRSSTIELGLYWLRKHYPVDEDAAIMARIEREEREEEEKLYRHAEELGLYKPQSGHWGAKLGEGGDIWGKSVLKEIREQNEARLLAEQDRERKDWLEGEEREREKIRMQIERNTELQKSNATAFVETRARANPEERPMLAWIQKHHLRATNYDIDPSSMTNARRILPALGITILTLVLSYVFAEMYQPPSQQSRMWRDVPPAAATVLALMGINFTVFTLWRIWPPAWRMLNRYFISVPMYPHALSVLGSIVSHQQIRHLATNMIILWFMGVRLHDEVGRGNFLAIFLASGAVGSMTSLAVHIFARKFTVTSLGASGAIAGLVAAWCTLHANDKLTVFFLPREWQETFSAKGWVFLTGIVLFEAFSLVSPFKVAGLDHWAHLGGYFAGVVWAMFLKKKRDRERQKRWIDRLLPG